MQENWLKPCLDLTLLGYKCLKIDSSYRLGGGCATKEFLDKHHLIVINDGRMTRFHIVKNTCSHIDLTCAPPNLAREWNILDRFMFVRDYFPILCRFGQELRIEIEESPTIYNFSQA